MLPLPHRVFTKITDARKWCLVFASAACGLLTPWRAGATPIEPDGVKPTPHRISAAVSGGPAFVGGDEDGHWAESGLAAGIGVGYAYDAGAEFGVGFDFFAVPNADRNIYLPYLGVRLHLGLSSRTELGLSLRGGLLWEVMGDVPDDNDINSRHTHVWFGKHAAISPDVRYWLSPKVAIDLGPSLIVGNGKDRGDVRGFYLSDEAGIAFLGLVGKFVFAP